ncbi:MAG: antitoxin Xre-like helix-turn-helix domain-containing protein [Cytophagales bacterium]
MKKTTQNTDYKIKEHQPIIASESEVLYGPKYELAMNDPFTMMEVVRAGVTKKRLLALADKTEIAVAELADILHISLRTIQRYSDTDTLDSHISEHIMLIDRLYRKGQVLFNAPHYFNEWMKRDLFDFNYQKPIAFIDTYSGIETVYNKLGQFEHGIFA